MAEIRAFIAIDIDRVIRERLAALQQQWRGCGADVSWARPEGIHLTLKFLGNVPEAPIVAIGDALEQVAAQFAPFSLQVAGTGGFPTLRRPRVIWAGVSDGDGELPHIAAAVDAAMATLGFPREDRPFRAHLTLGRVKSPTGLSALLPAVEAHADDQFGVVHVTELLLFRSELSPQGARYTVLRRVPLSR